MLHLYVRWCWRICRTKRPIRKDSKTVIYLEEISLSICVFRITCNQRLLHHAGKLSLVKRSCDTVNLYVTGMKGNILKINKNLEERTKEGEQ